MDEILGPNRVQVEHECFIPLPKHRIVQLLLEQIEDQQQRKLFRDMCRLLEAIYHFEFHERAEQLRSDFELFDPVTARIDRDRFSEEQLDETEERFLDNFIHLMKKANYRLLTQKEIDFAEAEDYLFTLPVMIDWDGLDSKMLSRYIDKHPCETGNGDPPQFARQILVFHRGVGVDQADGLHLMRKIDLMATKFLEFFIHLPGRAVGWISRKRRGPQVKVTPTDAPPAPSEPSAEPDSTGQAAVRSHMFADRYVERVTLRDAGAGFRSLFRRTKLQEPTFEELIILFRPASTSTDQEPIDRSIHIKAFHNIPMADLEVIFPDKKISMKPVDLIKLIATGIVGLTIVVVKFAAAVVLNPVVALAGAATVLGYAAKIFLGFRVAKERYQHVVTDSLYNKNMGNDLGVIFYLINALEEQEFKEMVLAYFFLWRSGPMTEAELDQRCERYLFESFDVEVDFEVDDALDKLVREKLVQRDGEQYSACPLNVALERLDYKWDNYFQYNNG